VPKILTMRKQSNSIVDLTGVDQIRVVVFASGYGSNFREIINRFATHNKIKIVGLFTDNPDAYAIERADKYGIPYEIIIAKEFKSRSEFDAEILRRLEKYKPDLIVLAGYLKVIKNDKFFEKYDHRIINIHPALLPAFKGTIHAQEEAYEYGAKVSGITIHFVNEDVDGGEVILQKCVDISDCESPEDVANRISKLEHEFYPEVISMFSEGYFEIVGKRVVYHTKNMR